MFSKDQNLGLITLRTHSFSTFFFQIAKLFFCVGMCICMCVSLDIYSNPNQCLNSIILLYPSICFFFIQQNLSIQTFFHLVVGWKTSKWKLDVIIHSQAHNTSFSIVLEIKCKKKTNKKNKNLNTIFKMLLSLILVLFSSPLWYHSYPVSIFQAQSLVFLPSSRTYTSFLSSLPGMHFPNTIFFFFLTKVTPPPFTCSVTHLSTTYWTSVLYQT